MTTLSRRSALQTMLAASAAPFVFRAHGYAAPSESVRHASFGASGMAGADINSLSGSKFFQLVAVADVDSARVGEVKKRFPNVKVYSDWRKLLDAEKSLDSANISTPDHMHAPITMRAMNQGINVYTQKPLTQTIYEARQLARVAAEKKLVTQMGIQIHSHPVHKQVVRIIQDGMIGKVKEVYSWSGKSWGDRSAKPTKTDPVPANLDWDGWLGVAAERPFIGGGYYHPGNWRKRLDFGTGTFGDMGCHIIDPVFGSLGLTYPKSVQSVGEAPNDYNWALNQEVHFVYPQTKFTTENLAFNWYNGSLRPPEAIQALVGGKVTDQGSIYVGTDGVLYSPYIAAPRLFPTEKFAGAKLPEVKGDDHYNQFVEAVRGNGKTSAPFEYAGPLTELVLLGCLATRFPKTSLQWDADKLSVTNVKDANQFVRKQYRKGWEVEGL